MRLTCPSCGAEYEVAEGLLPQPGRHVQCTACHTRWFARAEKARPRFSEDQIIRRLETRAPHLRPVPTAGPAPAPEEPAPFRWEGELAEAEPLDAPPDEPVSEAAAEPAEPEEVPAAEEVPEPEEVPPPPPSPLPDAVAGARPATRLGLNLDPDHRDEPAPRGPSRFGRGLWIALALFLLVLAAYLSAEPIGRLVPALAPALDDFAAAVDALRERVAAAFGAPTG